MFAKIVYEYQNNIILINENLEHVVIKSLRIKGQKINFKGLWKFIFKIFQEYIKKYYHINWNYLVIID